MKKIYQIGDVVDIDKRYQVCLVQIKIDEALLIDIGTWNRWKETPIKLTKFYISTGLTTLKQEIAVGVLEDEIKRYAKDENIR